MANLAARMLEMAGFGAVGRIMRIPSFRIYIIGHVPNVVGVWVVRIAIGWLAWQLTGSGLWLGAVAAADAMPVLLLGPIGGVLADRFDRRRISIAAQVVLTVISVVLTALTAAGAMGIALLFSLALARGVTFAFWQPVRLALMPNLVPHADIPTAIALNSSTFNAAQFVGPAIAGVLLTLGGPALAFAFNVFAAGIMIWALWHIALPARAPFNGPRPGILRDALTGIRYGLAHRGIGPMLLLLVVLGTMIRPVTELLPGIAESVFHQGVAGFSLMASSVGIGAMAGAIWMLRRGNRGGITAVALVAGLLGGAAAFLIAALAWLPLALLCLAVLGFSMTSAGIATQQAVQMAVPDEMRGRVLSLFGMIFRAAPATGALAMGWISDSVGLTWPVAVGAAFGLAVFALALTRRDRLAAALEGGGPEGNDVAAAEPASRPGERPAG